MISEPQPEAAFAPRALHAEMTVEETARHYPETLAVFARHRIDLCCGGKLTLAAAAEQHRVPIAALLRELEQAVVSKR